MYWASTHVTFCHWPLVVMVTVRPGKYGNIGAFIVGALGNGRINEYMYRIHVVMTACTMSAMHYLWGGGGGGGGDHNVGCLSCLKCLVYPQVKVGVWHCGGCGIVVGVALPNSL